ncbi:uncharacterized protein LOC121376852 [Gigantopelta aegis]|uniref:uncharacterized protein LOC121376852 n=1 Tax=Gigantopelta aegis TaxID=1735272 RepID=UPI001B88747F|nr:uncharacterized protein LOC121376852 [Gigantopelta aegis]
MKIAIILVFLVALVSLQEADAWGRFRFRRIVRRVWRGVKRVVRVVSRVKTVWNNAKQCWDTIKSIGKRDENTFDLNKDGHVDLEELGKMIGEREARDLMEALSGSFDPVPVEEFKRNVRDLAELSEEDLFKQVEELSEME